MKFSKEHYELIKGSIESFDKNILIQHRDKLRKEFDQGNSRIKDVTTRYVADVYYACVPLTDRKKIMDTGDYKDSHIQTAAKTVLAELGIL